MIRMPRQFWVALRIQNLNQVARVLALVPPWVRIYRIQRDIPMPLVTSGVEKGNLRELALARMGQLGLRCRDVRTREAGIQVHSPAASPQEQRFACAVRDVPPPAPTALNIMDSVLHLPYVLPSLSG